MIRTISLQDAMFTKVDYDMESRLLVVGTNNGTVCIWEVDQSNSHGAFT